MRAVTIIHEQTNISVPDVLGQSSRLAAQAQAVRHDEHAAQASAARTQHCVTLADEFGNGAIFAQTLSDPNNKIFAQRICELLQRLECRANSATLHPSNRRLCSPHSIGEFGLSQTRINSQPVHELPELSHPLFVIEDFCVSSNVRSAYVPPLDVTTHVAPPRSCVPFYISRTPVALVEHGETRYHVA
jgi:hypothetical protein